MKHIIVALLFAVSSVTFAIADYTEYIVKFKNPASLGKSGDVILQGGAMIRKALPFLESKAFDNQTLSSNREFAELMKYHIVRIPLGQETDVLEKLKSTDEIEEISANTVFRLNSLETPNDPRLNEQWALQQIRAAKAWQSADGEGIIVGVIDTGIDFNHPDLKNNLWINSKEDINGNGKFDPWLSSEILSGVSGDLNGIDDDGNGFIDDVIGYDMIDQTIANFGDWRDPDPIPQDENDHGTAIAGVIAAEQNNEIGVSGLAFKAKIMSVRVFDVSGNAESDDIAAAIVYAALNGAKVLNFSFGEVQASPLVHSAVQFAHSRGVIMIASSGNENKDISHYPSDYPEVISVGASTESGKRWDFSNYGGNLTLLAPGYLVLATVPGGFYSLKSGTSLASPFVSGAVAMLLQKNPNLKLNDIRAILSATATSVNPDGWDNLTGAGILNVADALDNITPAKMEIEYPELHSSVNKSKVPSVAITGSSLTPLFDSYAVLIGKGRNPQVWDTLSGRTMLAKIDDTLAVADLSTLQDTTYTVSMNVKLKNNKTLSARTQFSVYSSSKPFEITELRAIQILNSDRNALIVSAVTNQNSSFQLLYRPKGSSEEYETLSDDVEYSKNHQVLVAKNFDYDKTYEAVGKAIIHSKDTAIFNFEFQIDEINFPKYNFTKKPYTLERGYIYPQVVDFNKNGKPNVFYNDLSNLAFGKSYYAEFDGDRFNKLDSLSEGWLTVGVGNSNGDQFSDVLNFGGGKSFVYQPTAGNPSPYANKIFSTELSNFWAEQYYDLDGDGLEEIIAYNDSSFFAYSFKNGKYSLLAQALLPKDLRTAGIGRGSAVGDFDGSGTPKLYHSNNSGHSFIWEFTAGKFNLVYSNTEIKGADNQYISSIDVNGDGKPEILHGTYAVLPSRNDYASQIWQFRIIGSDVVGQYKILDSVFVYGVKAGTVQRLGASFRNGVSGGNIDGTAGDEIIISALPNLYVFKWNKSASKMEPLWHYPASFANSALVHDFDKNGKSEIGFATFSETEFWEYEGASQKLAEPHLKGWALSNTSAHLEWNAVDGADQYEILQLVDEKPTFASYGRTSARLATIEELEPNKYYRFFVAAVSNSKPEINGDLSNEATVFTNEQGIITSVEVTSPESFAVEFSVPLPYHNIEPSKLRIESEADGKIYSAKTALSSDSSVVLTMPVSLANGNYIMHSDSFEDYYGNPTAVSSFPFSVSIPEQEQEIYLTRLKSPFATFLQIQFSEAVDTSALNPNNYTIKPYGRVILVNSIPGEPATLDMLLSSELKLEGKGKNYYLTAKNITSENGRKITKGAGNTLGFAIAESNLENVFVYPNPIKYSEKPEVYIAGLTRRATLEIQSLEGEVLNTLKENDGNGGVYWDGTDNLGNFLKPGVYLIKVENTENLDSDFDIIKFMIVP